MFGSGILHARTCLWQTGPKCLDCSLRVPQVKSLKITVKDANGIIVKSEALKEEYRGKVAQLTRQLSEMQVCMSCRRPTRCTLSSCARTAPIALAGRNF